VNKVVYFFVITLVQLGAQVNYQNCNDTPLTIAIRNGKDDVARYLISSGARFDLQDRNGKTAFELAIEMCNDDLVTHMIEHT
jgi:ankyrin repeat protein